jgi:hypothetical protein
MTLPNTVITVDAPVATEPPAPPASPVLRIIAGLAGVMVLVLGAMISVGGALVGALGVWFAALVAKRRGRQLTRLMTWIGAISTTAVAILIAGGVLFANMPEGTFDEIRATIDSVQKAQAPPPGVAQDATDSARVAFNQGPASGAVLLIGGLIGGWFALMIFASIYGSIGWLGALLLVFALTGSWLGRRPTPSPVTSDTE